MFKVDDALKLFCGIGIERQKLKPGESATFPIPVPKNKKLFDLEFDFLISEYKLLAENDDLQAIWVRVNKQRKSYTGYQFKDE